MTSPLLSGSIAGFCASSTEEILTRYLPDFTVPGYFAGYRTSPFDVCDLALLLTELHHLGIRTLAGRDVVEIIRGLLPQVDGPATHTFGSYRIAEAVAAFGTWNDENPLLRGLDESAKENLLAAFDSTSLYDAGKDNLSGWPNNFWAVLARCEAARERLGVLKDRAFLEKCVQRVSGLLTQNPLGYFDDLTQLSGRYDIYTCDVPLFLEPIRHLFDKELIDSTLERHAQLVSKLYMENGAAIAWGRSIGALSICLAVEYSALAVRDGLAGDPPAHLARAAHALEIFRTKWMQDGLISAHRHRMTYRYRGPHRLLQMTLDCLQKLAWSARVLKEASDATAGVMQFEETDFFQRFSEQNAGVWMFRNANLSFQLPTVFTATADYVSWPHSPGLFENPVDSDVICGVPRVLVGGREYVGSGVPSEVIKTPGGLKLRFDQFLCTDEKAEPLKAVRETTLRVEKDEFRMEEAWSFESAPEAVTLAIPETPRSLQVRPALESGDASRTIETDGMPQARSYWGTLPRFHEFDFQPRREIRFGCKIRPVLETIVIPGDADYPRAFYRGVAARGGERIKLRMIPQHFDTSCMDPKKFPHDADFLHLGWPEHLFLQKEMPNEEFKKRFLDLIEYLGQSPTRLVWTMHNRRPHAASPAIFDDVYAALARVVDIVQHHSECGMNRMLADLPFNPKAEHHIIPHFHFGDLLGQSRSREDLEKQFGLRPNVLRLGVIGRPQKEKQIDLIARAFAATDRPDLELFITAATTKDKFPDDPRIRVAPRDGMIPRSLIAEHLAVVDLMIAAQTGANYLTSGQIADAVGVGIPMITCDWEFYRETMGDATIIYGNTEQELTAAIQNLTRGQVEKATIASKNLYGPLSTGTLGGQLFEIFDRWGAARR